MVGYTPRMAFVLPHGAFLRRPRTVLAACLLVALLFVGLALWAILDPTSSLGTWLVVLVVGPIVVIAATTRLESRVHRRGARPSEIGNVSRMFSLVALLLTVPVLLLQVLPDELRGTAGAAPNACPASGVPDSGFADVPPAATHGDSISCVAWWNVTRGLDASHFGPRHHVSGTQAGVFVERLVSAAEGGEATTGGGLVRRMVTAGMVGGDHDWSLGTSRPLTRGELAALLVLAYEHVRGADLGPARNAFADDDGHALEAEIDRAAAAGFVSGTGPRTFAPDRPVSREQMATAMVLLLDRLVVEDAAQLPA